MSVDNLEGKQNSEKFCLFFNFLKIMTTQKVNRLNLTQYIEKYIDNLEGK